MYRILLFVIYILIFLVGCSDLGNKELENKIDFLKAQLEQIENQLEAYKSIKADIEELEKVAKTASVSSLQVLKKLEGLDEVFYDGKYVKNLHIKSPKPITEDIVKGYIALIDQIESDLKRE